jgi:hypothetical protein
MPESFMNFTEGSGKKAHTFQRTIGANTVEDEVIIQGEQSLATYSLVTTTPPAVATAASHLLQIMAGASLNVYVRRIRVWQFTAATAAAFASLQLFRLTTAGTGGITVVTQAFDNADPAPGATGMTLPTVKGSESLNPVGIVVVQYVQTIPTGGPGYGALLGEFDFDLLRTKALKISAGVANGIAVKNIAATAGASVVVEAVISEANY